MPDSYLTLIGVVVASLLTFYGVLRKSRSDERVSYRSASAAEVEKMGNRLDKQAEEIEDLQRKMRALYAYIADDHDDHRRNSWPIKALPPEIA